jgi:hypothetical protein
MQQGDRNALERILAPAFVFIHSTGVLDSRQEFIDKTVRAPAPRDFEYSEEIIRIYGGHTAVWTTRSVRQGQGGAIFRGTDVLVRRGGRWQWAAVHSTALPIRPAAAAVPVEVLERSVGTYRDSRGRTLTVTRSGATLHAALTGFRNAELIPTAIGEYVWFDAENNQNTRVTFEGEGFVRVVIIRNGAEMFRGAKS